MSGEFYCTVNYVPGSNARRIPSHIHTLRILKPGPGARRDSRIFQRINKAASAEMDRPGMERLVPYWIFAIGPWNADDAKLLARDGSLAEGFDSRYRTGARELATKITERLDRYGMEGVHGFHPVSHEVLVRTPRYKRVLESVRQSYAIKIAEKTGTSSLADVLAPGGRVPPSSRPSLTG